MDIPESMKDELQAWNDGQGINLDGWRSCSGNFSLAVAYADLFNPSFVVFEDYLFQAKQADDGLISAVRNFENDDKSNKFEVEWVLNHEHIADLQYLGCEDISIDKILIIGNALKDIYESKLAYLFPDRPCEVKFYIPDDENDLADYQISFWQKKHSPLK